MKKLQLLFSLCFLFTVTSCKKDCQTFDTYQVDFFIDHFEFKLTQPVFETVSEQMLVKAASFSDGTVFKTLSEQVLASDGYTKRSILSKQDISIVVNAETNTIEQLSCYDFFDSNDFEEIEVPSLYTTRTYQVVDVQGTGIEVPAEYETRTFQRLISDSMIEALGSERKAERITFTIPDHLSIEEYIIDQLAQQSIFDCVENVSYKIVK